MTDRTRPVSELTFNELLAADITLGFDEGAGEVLFRDGITGRQMEPCELMPIPCEIPEREPEAGI